MLVKPRDCRVRRGSSVGSISALVEPGSIEKADGLLGPVGKLQQTGHD